MRIRTPHKAVVWNAGALDSFGQPTFSAPVEFSCRWQDRAQKVQQLAGSERVSNSKIYHQIEGVAKPGDRIAKGSRNELLLQWKSDAELESIADDLSLTLAELQSLLGESDPVDGLDYQEHLTPWKNPEIRMIGAIESTDSVNGSVKLFTIMTEVYAKGY